MERQEARPKARTTEVLARELESGEVVVYDRASDTVHCLNRSAALVWRHSDGTRTVEQLASLMHRELDLPSDPNLVHLALGELGRVKLLEGGVPAPGPGAGVTRRQMLTRLGYGAAVAALLPVVVSMVAPQPAAAASCLPVGARCTVNSECCSGKCVGGLCVP